MKKLLLIATSLAALFLAQGAKAQTNVQVFYDFGSERQYVTTTLEGFYGDNWGDTFFFADLYYSNRQNTYGASNGCYFEVERGINFWKDSSLKDLSLHLEYDGATWGSSIFALGAKYCFHSDDFSKMFTIYAMYDWMFGQEADAPVKITGVWSWGNLFGVNGLTFKGFFDFWGLNNTWGLDDKTTFSFLTEPQIWYNVGQHFGMQQLDLGCEIEISNNFAGHKGFMCNPCAGIRWTF